MEKRPIGVFDSGVGGLSCVGPLMKKMPSESILFFGDCLRAPYGGRPEEEIIAFSCEIADHLLREGCKALVIACNTISCLALDAIRSAHPGVPVIGIIEPAAKLIAAQGLGSVTVISTEATARNGAYAKALAPLCDCRVTAVGCPKFVPIIEGGRCGSKEAEAAVREVLAGAEERPNIVLGCTHYPFLRGDIGKVCPDARIIDPAEALAEAVFAELSARGLTAPPETPVYRLTASKLTDIFRAFAAEVMDGREYTLSESVL